MSSHDSFTDYSTPTDNDSESLNEIRARRFSMLMPLLLNLASRNQTPHQEPESGSEMNRDSRTRFTVTMVDGRTGSTLVMEGTGDIEDLFERISSKSGVSPASKASMDAMPRVVIDEVGAECAICLEMYEVGSEAREMPCKHRFHSGCINKWLGIHRTCPMCRFVMPAEERDSNGDGGSEGGDEGSESREAVVTLRLLVRDENSVRSEPMDAVVNADLGGESVDVDPNRQDEHPNDDADDSTSTTLEINLE